MDRKSVSELLMAAGMSPSLKGFDYVLDALELIDGDRAFLYSVTRLLYPAIADKHNSTPARVGRCIKHAIDVSFGYAGITAIEKIFGSAYSPVKGRPTNAEYLGALAEQIRYERSGLK